MVKISLVRQSNSEIDESSAPRVAVFVGGTSGIGKITLTELSSLGIGFKAYVVGRKESEQSFKTFVAELRQTNPKADVRWIEGEVSLLSECRRVCDHIKSIETKVDLLFMTTGYAPFGGRENTSEGIDVSHALEFYSRMCFAETLLPVLRASGRARVISVHAGGLEKASALNIDDITLEKPGAFGPAATQFQMGNMNTVYLERLAEIKENHSIVFIHCHPGIVRTGNLYRGWGNFLWGWGPWLAAMFMDPIMRLIAFSFKESGERMLYQATSGTFGGQGPKLPGVKGHTTKGEPTGSLFLVSRKCDAVKNEKELAKLRVKGQEAVWVKAREILGPFIS